MLCLRINKYGERKDTNLYRVITINDESYIAVNQSEESNGNMEFFKKNENVFAPAEDFLIESNETEKSGTTKSPIKKVKINDCYFEDRSFVGKEYDIIAENEVYMQLQTKLIGIGHWFPILYKDEFNFDIIKTYEQEYDKHLKKYDEEINDFDR